VFLDDIIIYSWKLKENEEHVRLVLQYLREHKLDAKLSKCSFSSIRSIIQGIGDGIVVDISNIKSYHGFFDKH
jgi:hypothetical protein